MARSTDPMSHARVITPTYGGAIPCGVLLADDAVLRDVEEALGIIERSSEDFALGLARYALGRLIVTERAERRTFQAIADGLMADGIPTARGKSRWYPATIKAVVTERQLCDIGVAPGSGPGLR